MGKCLSLLSILIGIAFAAARGADAADQPYWVIDGIDDPAFRDAAVNWLRGDDAGALPELAQAAHDGNQAAQMLLGMIELRGMDDTAWVASLSDDEYVHIFHLRSGGPERGWLRVAADAGNRLAALLDERRGDMVHFGRLDEIAARHEPRAAAHYFPMLFNAKEWDILRFLEDAGYLSGLSPYVWAARTYSETVSDGETWDEELQVYRAGVLEGYLFVFLADREDEALSALKEAENDTLGDVMYGWASVDPDEEMPAEAKTVIDRWLTDSPHAALLRNWCAAGCRATAAFNCRRNLYALLLGGTNIPLVVSSPLETIFAQEDWVRTPRAGLVLEAAVADLFDSERLERLDLESCVLRRLSATD